MAPPGTPNTYSTCSASRHLMSACAPVIFSLAIEPSDCGCDRFASTLPRRPRAAPLTARAGSSDGSQLLADLRRHEGAGADGDAVHHVEEGAGAPLDDVCGEGAAAVDAAVVLHLEHHLALRVLAGGDAGDAVVAQLHGHAGDLLDGLEDRVHRAVAGAGRLVPLPVGVDERDGGGRQGAGPGGGGEGGELPLARAGAEHLAVDHQRLEVGVEDVLLLVGQLL